MTKMIPSWTMKKHMLNSQAVTKAIHAVLLQVEFLSDCGLDLCLAVTSHKRVQLWASSAWRDDLKDTIRKAANYQADLEEHNINLDMFVEMKSPINHRVNHVDRANQTDTSTAPVSPSHDAVPAEQTAGSDVMEESIKVEPGDADQVFISQTEDSSYMDEDAPPDFVTPPHDLVPKHQIYESYVIEEESFETKPADVGEMINQDATTRCTEEGTGDLLNHLTLQPNSVPESVISRELMRAFSSTQPKARTICEQPEIRGSALTRVAADTSKEPLNIRDLSDITSTLPSTSVHSRIRNHEGKTNDCSRREYKSTRKSALLVHMRKHTGNNFNCDQCGYKSTSKCHLLRHKRVHTSETFNGDQCDNRCTRRDHLLGHMRKHTGETFNCDHCEYISTTKFGLISHMRLHTGETFNCDHCDYKSNLKSNLVVHLRKHTGETFNCGQCDYKSTTKRDLLRHVTVHTDETFNCDQCYYKSNFKKGLVAHMRKHTGETFNCDQCDYRSSFKNSLVAHMRKHTGETFNCDQCNYSSNFKNTLAAHMRKHTGETFNCNQCDYRSIFKCNLITHMRRHTSEIFICEQCNFRSTRKDDLLLHIKHLHSSFGK